MGVSTFSELLELKKSESRDALNLSDNKEKLNFFVQSIENRFNVDASEIDETSTNPEPINYIFYPFLEDSSFEVSLKGVEGLSRLKARIKIKSVLFYQVVLVNFYGKKTHVAYHGFKHKSETRRLKKAFKQVIENFENKEESEKLQRFEREFIDMYTDGL